MPEIYYSTISEAAAAFRSGTLSPVDLVEATLSRIEALDPRLNAFLSVQADSARAAARAAAAAFTREEEPGPLAGIPIGLKDLYDVAGLVTTAGSALHDPAPAAADCPVWSRLRAAGAVLLGKQNLHEWALGVTNANPHFGPCRDPWNLERIPGGSSGGSGAALAAGLGLGAFGSDTGGSIRIPASLCGVVGLKPTTRRVSVRGVAPLSWSLDHAGPLARSVADVALLLRVVDGYDAADPASVDGPRPDPASELEAGVAGLRVLLSDDYFLQTADPEVAALVESAARALESAGARVERVSLPGAEALAQANGSLVVVEAATVHAREIAEAPERIGADTLTRLRRGQEISGVEYTRARRLGVQWRRRFEGLLAGPTVLLTPTTPIPAQPIAGIEGVSAARGLTSYTGPFNLTGLPALSLPCGFTRDGLPVGLQIVGRPWGEATVLRAGAAYERLTDFHLAHPAL